MAGIKRASTVTAADIKAVRGELTQVEAAELLGISRRCFQNYESGEVSMLEIIFEHFKKITHKEKL